jgi:cellulose synthase/poly-beta-1,6-N-acetylglucosamine synthase-like glycosyltransferase
VGVVVATRYDPAFALERVLNLRAGEYPARLLRVLVAVDVNAAHPIDAYRAALSGLADVVGGDAPGGKAATLNAAVRAAGTADVLVFADVGQVFNALDIPHLVAVLRTEGVGAVTGRYTHARNDEIMSAYADFEARESMRWRGGSSAGTRWRYEPKRYEPNWRSLG